LDRKEERRYSGDAWMEVGLRRRRVGGVADEEEMLAGLIMGPICFFRKMGLICLFVLIFFYIFYHDFEKIYGPSEILQNYTSAAVAHGVRDITSWPTAVGADIASYPTALGA
jgi:hypothetical protein